MVSLDRWWVHISHHHLSWTFEAAGGILRVGDARPVRRQTRGYLPSRRELPPFHHRRIILLVTEALV